MDKEEIRESVTDFIPYVDKVIGKLKEDKKFPAVHTYTATKNSFMKYSEETGGTMAVSEIYTCGRLKGYEDWLRQRKASWNTVSTYMRTLKALYNRMLEDRLVEYVPKLFDDVYTKVESQTKRSLTDRQENTLIKADAEALQEDMQRTLAYCLLMFYFRGMAFIDLAHLRKQDLKEGCIVYCRHKTKRQIRVRVPKEAMELLEKYRNKDAKSTYLFPILNEEIGDDYELYRYYQRALGKFNRKLALLSRLLLDGIKISSYTARHTWATLAFYQGTPIGIISKALGHSSIKVTETYLKPFEDEKVDMENDKLILSISRSDEEKDVA